MRSRNIIITVEIQVNIPYNPILHPTQFVLYCAIAVILITYHTTTLTAITKVGYSDSKAFRDIAWAHREPVGVAGVLNPRI